MATQTYERMATPSRLILHYSSLFDEINDLKQRVMELENREKVVVLKEMTRGEAKQAIKEFFSSGRTLYYSDIVKELGIDLETVVEVCNELERDKEIAVSA